MGAAADWMESYLSDRYQFVEINGSVSEKVKLEYGFPQGSKIGPFGFKLYTQPLVSIAKKFGIQIHLYADDTQLYVPFDPANSVSVMRRLEACIAEVKLWMANNFLKLNADKTQFMILGGKHDLAKVSCRKVIVGNEEVLPSATVRNIGAMFDATLTMREHVNSVTKSSYFQIRNLSKIRKYLSNEAANSLTHAFITSRLDNLNSLLYNISDCQLKRLQSIQNQAARMITRKGKSEHITPILKDLHWLPVRFRIRYKILLLVYKCLHGGGPSYLASLLTEHQPSRTLRSAARSLLSEPRTQKKYGDRAFSVAGPKLWNSLSPDLKASSSTSVFKRDLKTSLFEEAYKLKKFSLD